MTEKRFTLHNDYEPTIEDNLKCKEYFYNRDIVDLLNELYEENQALKSDRVRYEEECRLDVFKELHDENEQLKQQKPFLKIIDDYFIQYEDGELFNLHKPSDIRSLMRILNREHGYSELQCEYNDLDKGDVK